MRSISSASLNVFLNWNKWFLVDLGIDQPPLPNPVPHVKDLSLFGLPVNPPGLNSNLMGRDYQTPVQSLGI